MLTLQIHSEEKFNTQTNEFEYGESVELTLEHSLLSVSKWESRFKKPFLDPTQRTTLEILGYVEAMCLTQDFNPKILEQLTQEHINQINDYIGDDYSATTFGSLPEVKRGRRETVTSELIYYWMVAFNIPFECESWHLNRLFALIKICNLKNSKPKKMSRQELAARNRELNNKRRAELGTRG